MAYTKQNVPSNELSTFGARLRYEREHQNLSRAALAKLTGSEISARVIDHLENGTTDATLQKIDLLAEALSISQDWLIKGEETTVAPVDPSEAELAEELETTHYYDMAGLLVQLDDLREEGITNHPRLISAIIDDIRFKARYLEVDELIDLGTVRELEDVEGTFLLTNAVVEEARAEVDTSELVNEHVERLIDTALLGFDLYSLTEDDFTNFAKEREISLEDRSNKVGFFPGKLKGLSKLVPACRSAYWTDAAMQVDSNASDDIKQDDEENGDGFYDRRRKRVTAQKGQQKQPLKARRRWGSGKRLP